MLGPVPVPVPLRARCYRRRGRGWGRPRRSPPCPPPSCPGRPGAPGAAGRPRPGVTGTGSAAGTRGGFAPGPKPATPGPEAPPCPVACPRPGSAPGLWGGAQGAGPVRARWTLPPAAFVTRRLPVLGSNRSVPCAGDHPVNPGSPRGSRGAAVPPGLGPGRPRPCPPHSILGAHGHGGGTGRLPGGPPRAAASPPGPVLPVPALGPLLAPAARAPFLPRGARRGPGRRCRYRQPRGGGCALLISRPRP